MKELADLLIQSSCTPPFVPVKKRNGIPALDGGIVDNVPADAISKNKGKTLILLTRHYPIELLEVNNNRLYIQPSQPIDIKKWDYTNPDGLQKVFELGIKDAELLLKDCT